MGPVAKVHRSYTQGMSRMLACLVAVAALAADTLAGPVFRITLPATAEGPVSGRLVIGFVSDAAAELKDEDPNNAPFWDNPQPLLGADVKDLAPGASVEPTAFDVANLSKVEALSGTYRVAARLITTRQSSSWRRDRGNLQGPPVTVTFKPGTSPVVELSLPRVTEGLEWPASRAAELGVSLVEVKSTLLSEFHGKAVTLRAAVTSPVKPREGAKLGAIYVVPGFGGRYVDAIGAAAARAASTGVEAEVAAATRLVMLDPESPNGHTLFADSANNGPWGRALVEELIPAIEAKFPDLDRRPEARIVTGHSSGGWSSLWLAISSPGTFGACWSTAPDPVDFRRFQLIDLYGQESAYQLVEADDSFANPMRESRFAPASVGDRGEVRVQFGGRPRVVALGSYRAGGRCIMTVERETRQEDVLGPDNTSGQQWDSWMAVFAPRNDRGHPAALFDPASGLIDRRIAESMRTYDISARLIASPATIGKLFRERIRLVVGEADNFYLDEAVRLLKTELDRRYPPQAPDVELGSIELVPDADHSSILRSNRVRRFPLEMLMHLQRHDLAPRAAP
jgi:hypothetical protein